MTNPLLRTKLFVPPAPSQWVPRSRLVERLSQGLGRKLTLVSAPAGFGKTTLLSEWVQSGGKTEVGATRGDDDSTKVRFAWLSLDDRDNDPTRFLSYAIGALQSVSEGIGDSALEMVQALQAPGRQVGPWHEGVALPDEWEEGGLASVLGLLINDLASIPGQVVLILDDYHQITAQPIHDALSFLLDHMPANVHLAVATRADPPLPVARLRGRGQLNELRMMDLRFSAGEAAGFLRRVVEMDLAEEDVRTLSARTEGWIAGLQMTALALQAHVGRQGTDAARRETGRQDAGHGEASRASAFIRGLTGSDRYILDYLVEEVLDHEPQAIQSFLMRTSILERLTASLCDAVVEVARGRVDEGGPATSSQEILEHLERANLFIVPLDNERRWYRYHRLLADLLRSRLQATQAELVPALHRGASAWFEAQGWTHEAIDHALGGNDVERAALMVEGVAEEALLRGELLTFLHWVEGLPDSVLHSRPSLCAFCAWVALLAGQPIGEIEGLLNSAERGDEVAAGRALALRGLIAGFRGNMPRSVELASRALAQLPAEDQYVRTFTTWLLRMAEMVEGGGRIDKGPVEEVLRMSRWAGNVTLSVVTTCNWAEILLRQGQLREAEETYVQALELATDAEGRRTPMAGQVLVGLGEVMRQRGDLEGAERLLTEAIELTERWSETGVLEAHICMGRIRWAQGDREGAWRALERAQELAERFDVTELDDWTVAMFQGSMRVAQGNLEPVRRWAEKRDLYRYIDSSLVERPGEPYEQRLRKYELLVLARLLTAEGRVDEALKLLDSLVPVAEWRARPGMLLEVHLLEALAYQEKGDVEQALEALECALTLGEPEGYVAAFVEEGPRMARLLYAFAARQAAATALREYAARLLAAFPGTDERAKFGAKPLAGDQAALVEPLSERELDVLALIAEGLSNGDIAERLVVSVNTVKTHARSIYGKLGVHSRTQAIARAKALGLLVSS